MLPADEVVRGSDDQAPVGPTLAVVAETPCRTSLLVDSPTLDDEFGVHSQLASLLAELVEDKQSGSACLLGEWGAGKSSVLRILEARLQEAQCEALVFTFDAWTHQGDPLRRVFLESLGIALLRHGWITAKEYETLRRALSGTEKTTLTQQRASLKPGGLAVTLVALLATTLAATVNPLLKYAPPAWFGWVFGAFVGAAVLPFVIALVISAVISVRSTSDSGETRDDVLAAFVSRPPTEVTTRTFEPNQLDTMQFQLLYDRLVRSALGDDRTKRLVLAIDNLDRVPREAATSLWATMRLFVDSDSSRGADGAPPVWVVVPVAESAAETMWDAEGDVGSSERVAKDAGPSSDNNGFPKDPSRTSHAMLSKSFQVRLDVPLLIKSDFRSYFVQRFRDAFPDHSEDEAVPVCRMYQRLRPDPMWYTPRETKRFLNELVMVHRQHRHSFPLATQGLYVIARNMLGASSAGDIILAEADLAGVLGDLEWRQNLAAMTYAVEPMAAMQVLLQPKILKALDDRELDGLAALCSFPGFWDVFAEAVESHASGTAGLTTSDLAWYASSITTLAAQAPSPLAASITASLSALLPQTAEWRPLEAHAAAVAELVEKSADPTRLARSVGDLASDSIAFDHGVLQGVAGINAVARRLRGPARESLCTSIRLPGDDRLALEAIAAWDLPNRVVPMAGLTQSCTDSLSASYVLLLSEEGPSKNEPFRLGVLVRSGLVEDLDEVCAAALRRLALREQLDTAELVSIWATIAAATRLGGNALSGIAEAAEAGHLSYFAASSVCSEAPPRAAVLLMTMLHIASGSLWTQMPAWEDSHSGIFMQLDEPSDSSVLDAAVSLLRDYPLQPRDVTGTFGFAVLRRLLNQADLQLVPMRMVLRAVDVAGSCPLRVAKHLAPQWRLLLTREYARTRTGLYFQLLQELEESSRDSLSAYVADGLRGSYTAADWIGALRTGATASRLLKACVERMGGSVSRPFAEAVASMATDGVSPSAPWTIGDLLMIAWSTDSEYVSGELDRRFDALTSAKDARPLGDMVIFLQDFLSQGVYMQEQKDVRRLLSGLLRTNRAKDVEAALSLLPTMGHRLGPTTRLSLTTHVNKQLKRKWNRSRYEALLLVKAALATRATP